MKIKLRDMTFEQYEQWTRNNMCERCDDCIFRNVYCNSDDCEGWVYHKDMYSDKFLNQEIEIDVPRLTGEERKYLKAVIKPFRDNVKTIEKIGSEYFDSDIDFVVIHLEEACISIPIIEDLNFKGMETNKKYTLEELGL